MILQVHHVLCGRSAWLMVCVAAGRTHILHVCVQSSNMISCRVEHYQRPNMSNDICTHGRKIDCLYIDLCCIDC